MAQGWPGGGPGVARGALTTMAPAEGHCDYGTGDGDPGDEGPGNDGS